MDNKIKIVGDSTCDLSPELISEMDIAIVPLYVTIGGKQYKDGLDLKEHQLYDLVDEHGELPKTAAPSPADFEALFRAYIDQGYDILFISISTNMSGTYQNAVIAKDLMETGTIEIVDGGNLSTGTGLLLTAAYDLIQQDNSLEQVVSAIHELIPKVKSSFTIDTFDYLHKGGRCSAMTAVVGGMLQIKPIIKVVDKSMTVGAKIRGKKKKALDYMIKEAIGHKDQMLHDRIFITHTTGSEKEALYLKDLINHEIPTAQVIITYAGCVIASHCGKKTIGVLYIAH